jgi:2,4-dienoyl-CoA reductase-like NADH-dependent reductase (Old Yellow Enzyme family)
MISPPTPRMEREMKLFSQTRVGALALDHRVVLAPLTRMRTQAGNVPGDLTVESDESDVSSKDIRRVFNGTIIVAGGFTRDSAGQIVLDGHADLVAFGRMFLANPDLPERLRTGQPLNRQDRSTFYGGDGRGYTDYPFALSQENQASERLQAAHA